MSEQAQPAAATRAQAIHSGLETFQRDTVAVDAGRGRQRQIPSRLTRQGMEEVIRSGMSVIIDGQVISEVKHLPTDTDLAKSSGNQSEIDRVREEKEKELDKLRQEIAELRKPAAAKTDPAQQNAPATSQGVKK